MVLSAIVLKIVMQSLVANNNSRPGVGSGNKPTARPVQKDNNVFADKDGNVYNRDKDGNINQRDNKSNSWTPTGNKEVASVKANCTNHKTCSKANHTAGPTSGNAACTAACNKTGTCR